MELRCGVPLEHERAERVGPRDRTERHPVADDRAEVGASTPRRSTVIGERHLLGILSKYLEYYNGTRTHLSLAKDAPRSRSLCSCRARAVWWRCRASVD